MARTARACSPARCSTFPASKSSTSSATIFRADGARALAAALQHVPRLASLYVGDNVIFSDGARALAGALQHVPRLEKLYVSGNIIGRDAMAGLSAAAAAACMGVEVW